MRTFTSIKMKSIYHHTIEGIDGQVLDFKEFAGKWILIVNVASACGYTTQYTQLQELYTGHSGSLVVLGCPCNDFGGQEPNTEMQIMEFCQTNYNVNFPMTKKIGIKHNPHPLYSWLMDSSLNGVADHDVAWNFHKFLVNKQGQLIASYPSSLSPLDDKIIAQITG